VGTHRRISAAPPDPCAANADGRPGRTRGHAGASPIDRPTDPSPRAVKGPRRQAPLRRSGLRGVAARIPVAAAPIFLRAGRKGQRASRVLYIGNSHDVAEPGLACPSLTPLSRQVAWRTAKGATLGQGGIPMSQIAPAVGTAPARRLRRLVAGGCGSIRFIRRTLRRPREASVDRRAVVKTAFASHHPATAATGRSRSAPRPSNHSDMAAH
jgi:hypothetical protein